MTGYDSPYKRVAQAIIKAEGKLGTDTRAFADKLAVKLRAEGWQDTPAVQALINDYLAAVDTTLKTALTTAAVVGAGSLQSKAVLKLAEQAFAEHWPDGLTLSERLWRWHKATRDGVQTQLQRGIKQGKATGGVVMAMQRTIERTNGGQRFKVVSSHADQWVEDLHQTAQSMIHNPAAKADWQTVVDDVGARISGLSRTGTRNAAERLLDQVKEAVKKGNEALLDSAVKWWTYGQQLYHLKRIVRTEMATAAHRAVIASSIGDPDIIGFQWRLSGSHPAADICDYYANIEMGLGKGVWTKDAVPHHKAHPHCMCLIIPRVTPVKQTGSKNYGEFIERVTPQRRAQLLPKWADTAVKSGVPLARLVRADGLGLIAKTDGQGMIAAMRNNDYEAAKSGNRHKGLYQQWKGKRIPEIEKSIRSLHEQIKVHQDKMANPVKYVDPDLSKPVLDALVMRYWPKEITNFEQQINVLTGILMEKKT